MLRILESTCCVIVVNAPSRRDAHMGERDMREMQDTRICKSVVGCLALIFTKWHYAVGQAHRPGILCFLDHFLSSVLLYGHDKLKIARVFFTHF